MMKLDLSRKVYFFADLHADRQAFETSVSHCEDPTALYIIGGDCLDKGPSNLDLLDAIYELSQRADVKILAGNHDLRMLMVLQNWYDRENKNGKFAKIFTPKRFLKRIDPFLDECGGINKARQMFLEPEGKYSWFFDNMEPFYRDGEFLFVHAGVGDEFIREISPMITCTEANPFPIIMRHRNQLPFNDALHDFYYGPLGTCIRTKYREDTQVYEFTESGASLLEDLGINFVVHGHDNQLDGHKLNMRHGILHFCCDCTVDSGTRKAEGLTSPGYAVASFEPYGGRIEMHSAEGSSTYNPLFAEWAVEKRS